MHLEKRIEIMEHFTTTYQTTPHLPKAVREITCMATQFPDVFVLPKEKDRFVGRFIMLPVGHGLEWAHLGGGDLIEDRKAQTTHKGASIPEMNSAGPSYYGHVDQLIAMTTTTDNKDLLKRLKALIDFWSVNDTHTQMAKQFSSEHDPSLFDADINNFLPPILILTRLSGIEMDYTLLLEKGLVGFKDHLSALMADHPNDYISAGAKGLALVEKSIHHYIEGLKLKKDTGNKPQLEPIVTSLLALLQGPPQTFHDALQLIFLYSQLAGVVNYGRMDDTLGSFLEKDLSTGLISEQDALEDIKSFWHLINESCNRGNGRVIIGGAGRKNPQAANLFVKLALQATIETKIPKPQLTLRMDPSTPESLYDLALDAIGQGCTFPMLYNDAVNVPALAKAMDVPLKDAQQYVPYGCGEYIINGRGTGSPNVCVNFTKILQLALNKGYDPFDGTYRGGEFDFLDPLSFTSYSHLERYYYSYLDYVLSTTVAYQHESYQYLASKSAFVLPGLLMHDTLKRGKPMLDGGIRYYSGVNEFYGFTNAIDSLQAIKEVVYDHKQFTLNELVQSLNTNFDEKGPLHPIQKALSNAQKFGNDLDDVDALAIRLHEHACEHIRTEGKKAGLHSFLAVNINNNANTRWGLKTGASYDGRVSGEHLAPGNNPHSGRDENGITAMLNSVSKFRPEIHAGYVQNLKCSPDLFNNERAKLKMIFSTYFDQQGGTQLMVNVMDQSTLLEAKKHPEKYPNLLVRCGGFSARFVELDEKTQTEIIERTCNA